MASLAELARIWTDLDGTRIAHLQRLAAAWGLLSDFSFADLLLFAPTRGGDGGGGADDHDGHEKREFVVMSQIRPTTGQTLYKSDWVGTVVTADDRPIVARAFAQGELLEGEIVVAPLKERVRALAIPVRWHGPNGSDIIAVLTKESTPTFGRQPGELEKIYVEIFNRFARMIASGDFPFVVEDAETDAVPRVGDGVLLLDSSMRVEYSSPNAVSALHRIGVHANTEGMRLGELGLDETPILTAFAGPMPVTRELERGPEVVVVLRCVPLVADGKTSGAVVLLRDISELRRRDRLLLTKDATIREIHHRVKNNLQTISSLLRLQGRRLASPEAKSAIEESVRRVRSIALVHEILAREAGEDVPFLEIVTDLARMAEEAYHDPERPIRCRVEGDPGTLPAMVATPLAVVLNELLQNAADHAFPTGGGGGTVVIQLRRDGPELVVDVVDDGQGLPVGFDLEARTGLGLSIVRTLVTSELMGSIDVTEDGGGGARVTIRVPVENRP
ncbi:MAG: sensor histidine kinase [Acidimicrobiales bacterium]